MSDWDLRRYADKCDGLVRDDRSEPEGTPNDGAVRQLMAAFRRFDADAEAHPKVVSGADVDSGQLSLRLSVWAALRAVAWKRPTCHCRQSTGTYS